MYILIGALVLLAILIYCIAKNKKKSSILRKEHKKRIREHHRKILESSFSNKKISHLRKPIIMDIKKTSNTCHNYSGYGGSSSSSSSSSSDCGSSSSSSSCD